MLVRFLFSNMTYEGRRNLNSRVDTDVDLEVAYSCNIFAVPDSLTCPDIQTSWCHSGIIEHFEIRGFKMTPWVIRGSKIKSASILFKSVSERRPWLKNSKNVIIFQMRHVVLTLGVVKGQRLVFRLYRGQKIKLLRFSWKWWQIVHLLERIQKKNTLYYLTCQVTEIWCKKSLLPLAEWWPVTFWSKNIWRRHWR